MLSGILLKRRPISDLKGTDTLSGEKTLPYLCLSLSVKASTFIRKQRGEGATSFLIDKTYFQKGLGVK